MSDLISRQWLLECVDEGWIKFDTEKDANIFIHLVRDIAPGAQPVAPDTNAGDTISRQAAIDVIEDFPHGCVWNVESMEDMADMIKALPSAQPEKEIPKRVLWSGWKGIRNTRYKCPNCKKPVRNTDVYCHRCGQKLMFPNIDFTPYVEGQKQELIVRWDDEEICGKKIRG